MMCVWQRASEHHVRARSLPFECGDDDYLFIIIVGVSVMRAAALPLPRLLPPLPPLTPRSSRSHSHHALYAACVYSGYTAHACGPCLTICRLSVALAGCGDCCFLRAALERLSLQQGWRMTRGNFDSRLSDSSIVFARPCPVITLITALTGHRCVRCHQVTAGT